MKHFTNKVIITLLVLLSSTFFSLQWSYARDNTQKIDQKLDSLNKVQHLDEIGLTQQEIDSLFSYLGSLDLNSILPKLGELNDELNAIDSHPENSQLTTNDKHKLVSAMNEVFGLLQLETDIFFIDGEHKELMPLEKVLSMNLDNKEITVQLSNNKTHKKLADFNLNAQTFKQVTGMMNKEVY